MNWEQLYIEPGQIPEFPLDFLCPKKSEEVEQHVVMYYDTNDNVHVIFTKKDDVIIPQGTITNSTIDEAKKRLEILSRGIKGKVCIELYNRALNDLINVCVFGYLERKIK